MFETVRPEIAVRRSRALMYETLPLSLAFHGVLVLAVMMGTYWKLAFPQDPPRLSAMYRLTAEPPPPPPPPPPPKGSTARPADPTDVRPVPTEIVAPTVIPDQIPAVPSTPLMAEAVGTQEGVEGGVVGGVVGGTMGGVIGGVIGGVEGGVVTDEPQAPPNTVVVARDEPLPMSPVSMVYPEYPELERLRGNEDRVIVRYIIGRNGRVREVTVLDKALIPAFTTATVKAIRNWRFRPLMKDGVAQEVVHELTVYFKLERDA